jgi:uncharacterized protein YraI
MFPSGFTLRRTTTYLIVIILLISLILFSHTAVHAQTIVLCAAPGSSLSGIYVTVNADQVQVNVRSGPNSYQYEKIGILYTYESAPAIGRSPGGDWIQISCPGVSGGTGWIYAAYVTLSVENELPVLVIPETNTPVITLTVDPVLAAEFPVIQPTSTRLPTFTPASPQTPPSFPDISPTPLNKSLQGGLIIGVVIVGIMVLLISFLLRR